MTPPLLNIEIRRKARLFFSGLRVIAFISIVYYSCRQSQPVDVTQINGELQSVDSILLKNKGDSAIPLLQSLSTKYRGKPVPFMSVYYRIRANQKREDPLRMEEYADSAVAVFDDQETARLFPAEYVEALTTKGEACKINLKFNLALQFYYKALEVENISNCSRSLVLSKIAGIYYDQENFSMAGRLWYTAYTLLDSCNEAVPQKLFMLKQGVLDNAGLAYDKAGDLDSAAYYYRLDINQVNTEYRLVADTNLLNPARMVVYDNIGGLYIKRGMLDSAAWYLEKAVSLNFENKDAIAIPPLLKLADLYTRTGDYGKAQSAFEQSRKLLESYSAGGHTPDSKIKWHKLFGAYLMKAGRLPEAYAELNTYIQQRDSLDRANRAIKAINVGKEFSIQEQQHTLTELRIKDTINQVYRWAIALVIVLSLVIIFLVYRNLYKSRKSHNDAILHNQDLEKALEQVEAANKNYLRIMRVMAHDLRNPLGGITGIAALLQSEQMSEDAKRMVQLIEATSSHSMEMIDELLKSGLAEENEAMAVQKLDISIILQDTVEVLQYRAKEKDQLLSFEKAPGPVWANINQEKMWRVFNNVIVNAIKFTQPGGEVKVRLQQKENHVVIAISDNGIGIPEKNWNTIFNMFTEAKRPGTSGEKPFGLGLSISRTIIEKHKGRIWFESAVAKGTTFYIELPLAE